MSRSVRATLDAIEQTLTNSAETPAPGQWEVWEVTDGLAKSRDGTMCTLGQLDRKPLRAGWGRILIHRT